MSKIKNSYDKRPAYLGYLTAGDGGIDRTRECAIALSRAGVDILEIGVPFSDPVADGPIIQAASQRAVDLGVSLEKVLHLINDLKQEIDTPIILFSYFNPIYAFANKTNFYKQAASMGVDGILVVDLPLEEAHNHLIACRQYHIDPILLISPSTPSPRIMEINKHAQGMLYYVCRNGTTGVKHNLPAEFSQKMKSIKNISNLPIAAGFGISNREMAAEVLQHADGFVVGSLFVNAVSQGICCDDLMHLAKTIDPRT